MFVIDQALVVSTPVDTGAARSNWLPSLSFPADRVVPPRGVIEAIQEARQVQAAYEREDPDEDARALYITNNLKYVPALNNGWSRQAPAGFVQRAIAIGLAELK